MIPSARDHARLGPRSLKATLMGWKLLEDMAQVMVCVSNALNTLCVRSDESIQV